MNQTHILYLREITLEGPQFKETKSATKNIFRKIFFSF